MFYQAPIRLFVIPSSLSGRISPNTRSIPTSHPLRPLPFPIAVTAPDRLSFWRDNPRLIPPRACPAYPSVIGKRVWCVYYMRGRSSAHHHLRYTYCIHTTSFHSVITASASFTPHASLSSSHISCLLCHPTSPMANPQGLTPHAYIVPPRSPYLCASSPPRLLPLFFPGPAAHVVRLHRDAAPVGNLAC